MTTDKTPATLADAVDGWPEHLMIRDTGLADDMGGLGQRIFTTAGAGYIKRKYIREDLAHPATLATAKHGGCVQLPTSERERFEEWAASALAADCRLDASGEYNSSNTQGQWLAWQAALSAQPQYITDAYELGMRDGQHLSAQPSPGGQGELDCIGRIEEAIEFRVPHDIYAAVHGELSELKAALAARQPVGEPVCNVEGTWLWSKLMDWCKKMGAAPGNHDELFAIAKEAQALFAAPPAQAVDLGQFREAVEHWRKHHAGCASAPALLGNEACAEHAAKSAAGGRLIALIDSHSGVRHG